LLYTGLWVEKREALDADDVVVSRPAGKMESETFWGR